ncbi:hypothetical protein AUP68_10894 [Ilyonectria robusta]
MVKLGGEGDRGPTTSRSIGRGPYLLGIVWGAASGCASATSRLLPFGVGSEEGTIRCYAERAMNAASSGDMYYGSDLGSVIAIAVTPLNLQHFWE